MKDFIGSSIKRKHLEEKYEITVKDWVYGIFGGINGVFYSPKNSNVYLGSFGTFYRENDLIMSLEYKKKYDDVTDSKYIKGCFYKKIYENVDICMSHKVKLHSRENKTKFGLGVKLNDCVYLKGVMNQNF